MYDQIQTILLLAVVFAAYCLTGYGLVKLLLPKRLGEYGHVLLPVVGYPAWLLATHFISGTLQIGVAPAGVAAFVSMLALSAYAFLSPSPSAAVLAPPLGGSREILVLCSTTAIVLLWPLVYVGARTFVASVNPDFFLGLLDNHWMYGHPSNTIKHNIDDSAWDIFDTISGSISESARYRGGFIAILLDTLLGIAERTGLAVALGFFYLCIPLSTYFMARVAFAQPRKVAVTAALLVGISASLALSYISYYVGQTSVMAYVPALLTLWYLVFNGEDRRMPLFWLASILTGAVWVSYTGMIVYIAGPIFIFAMVLIVRRRLSAWTLVAAGAGFLAFLVALHVRMLHMLVAQLNTWVHVVNLSSVGFLSQYYLDYITERFFAFFYGLAIYTMNTSVFYHPALEGPIIAESLLITAALAFFVVHWYRNTAHTHARYFGASLVAVYTIAFAEYEFIKPYGYGSFKQSMWFQFLLMFFVAYAIVAALKMARSGRRGEAMFGRVFLVVCAAPMVLLNVVNSVQYGYKALGTDTDKGYMVVVHNVSGNKDYLQLGDAARQVARPDESIGISLINIAQNSWAMYYLKGLRLSYLGSWAMPGDDENLPDRVSRIYYDPYGNPTPFQRTFYHGATDAYYLVNRPGHVNADIFLNNLPKPVWQDDTFQLVRSEQTPGFLFPGQGFYRAEFREARDGSYLPVTFRWSSRGGEFYMLNPEPGKPYRISMTVYAGLNAPRGSAQRTIDFFHNGDRIGSAVVVNGFARVVSDVFYPSGKEELLRFEVREKVKPVYRANSLWNANLPPDYRELNVWVANVRVETDDQGRAREALGAGEVLRGPRLFDRSIAFNGVEPNYWTREDANFRYEPPKGATKVRVTLLVPQVPGATWPQHVKLSVGERESVFELKGPGETTLEAPLPADRAAAVDVRIVPGYVFTPKDYSNLQVRDVVQGVRVNSVAFL